MMNESFFLRGHTLAPKFKVWHALELGAAVQSGTIFVATDASGQRFSYQLKTATAVGGMLSIEKITDEPDQSDADNPHRVSVDQIVHIAGPWPDYLSLRCKRPGTAYSDRRSD